MENTYFIFAPNNGWIYSTPKRWKGANLIASLADFLKAQDIAEMLCGAFGPGKENCFFAWKDSNGQVLSAWGDDSDPELIQWIKDNPVDEHVRCSLGPNKSFIIWDSKQINWKGIPRGLEAALLGWLSPTGWKEGPPRIVTIGAKESYFAMSEYGAVSWSVDPSLTSAHAAFLEMKQQIAEGKRKYTDLEYVNIASCNEENFLYVWNDMDFKGDVPDPVETWCEVFEDLMDEAAAKSWRQKRKQESKSHEQEQAKRKQEEAKLRREKQERLAQEAEELAVQYLLWRTAWEADILHKKMLTIFPHLPRKVCNCAETSCIPRKTDTGLLACQHDVENFLRASESYSIAWLRKERLLWHPDRFGQRCDPDFRKDLKRKATEMYAIFETLIAQELGETEE